MSVKKFIKFLLPDFILQEYYTYKIKKQNYYGHHELDKKLKKYLNYESGFYIELGANDGITQSNTYYFEKNMNWNGLLIEPINEKYLRCKKNRSKKNFFYNKACVGFNYKSKKIKIIYSNLMSSLNDKNIYQTVDPMEHTKKGEIYLKESEKKKEFIVEATTLTQILDDIKAPLMIDFLSLDVEGTEIEVLNGINFEKYKFKFILIESNNNDEEIIGLLKNLNYSFIEKISKRDLLFKNIFYLNND
tara:strand:- start:674 stop:1411 length:738 start_codon:yes stop_codon:yes gene_type:complete